MISIEAWRAVIGSFSNNRCGICLVIHGSNNVNRYHVCVIALLLLPFTVFGLVILLSSTNLKPKCVCADFLLLLGVYKVLPSM